MNKWKITQIFINLPPQKQVVAGLFFTVLCLASVVVFYEFVKIPRINTEHRADIKLLNQTVKYERGQNVYLQNRYLDFMEREINTRFEFKTQIDSLKSKTVIK